MLLTYLPVLETVLILFCFCEENDEVYEITMLSVSLTKFWTSWSTVWQSLNITLGLPHYGKPQLRTFYFRRVIFDKMAEYKLVGKSDIGATWFSDLKFYVTRFRLLEWHAPSLRQNFFATVKL